MHVSPHVSSPPPFLGFLRSKATRSPAPHNDLSGVPSPPLPPSPHMPPYLFQILIGGICVCYLFVFLSFPLLLPPPPVTCFHNQLTMTLKESTTHINLKKQPLKYRTPSLSPSPPPFSPPGTEGTFTHFHFPSHLPSLPLPFLRRPSQLALSLLSLSNSLTLTPRACLFCCFISLSIERPIKQTSPSFFPLSPSSLPSRPPLFGPPPQGPNGETGCQGIGRRVLTVSLSNLTLNRRGTGYILSVPWIPKTTYWRPAEKQSCQSLD